MAKRILKILVGLLIGAGCTWLVINRVDTSQLLSTVVNADLLLLTLAVVLFLSAHISRAALWVLLSGPNVQLSLRDAARLVFIGNLANLVIPLRGGELARVWLLGVRGGVGSGRAATIIMVERTVDMLILFCLVAAGTMVLGLPERMGSGAVRLAFGSGVAIVGLILLYILRGRLKSISGKLAPIGVIGKPLSALVEQFGEGLEQLQVRKALLAVAMLLFSWSMILVGLHLRMAAFHINAPIGSAVVILAAGNIVTSVQVVPAGIGVYEYATVLCLEQLGVAAAAGLAFAAASHALTIAVLAIAGTIALAIDQAKKKRSSDETEDDQSASKADKEEQPAAREKA